MDATTEKRVDYTLSTRYEDLPASAIAACKVRLVRATAAHASLR